MQYRRIGCFAATTRDFPFVWEAAFGGGALDEEEVGTWRGCRGGSEYEATDGEVGVLLVEGEEGGEGNCEMAERRGDVDLNGGLGFHSAVAVSYFDVYVRKDRGK